MIGAEDCCDGTTKWTFQVNDGEWEDWTTANFDKYMNQTIEEPPYDPAECHNCFSIDPFPLMEAVMTVKTVEFSGSVITDSAGVGSVLNEDLVNALNQAPGQGYCEMWTWWLNKTSNTELCGYDAATTDVGFYARVTFPVCFNATKYSFSLPVSPSDGGLSKLDNQTMKSFYGTDTGILDFETTLDEGNHILEVYASWP